MWEGKASPWFFSCCFASLYKPPSAGEPIVPAKFYFWRNQVQWMPLSSSRSCILPRQQANQNRLVFQGFLRGSPNSLRKFFHCFAVVPCNRSRYEIVYILSFIFKLICKSVSMILSKSLRKRYRNLGQRYEK